MTTFSLVVSTTDTVGTWTGGTTDTAGWCTIV